MRALLLVAGVELKRRLRNKSAVFTAFVGPLALASVFGVLMSGTSSFTINVGVVDLDHSEVTASFANDLLRADDTGPLRFVAYDTQQTAAAAIDDDDLDSAIVLPAGFGAAVMSGSAAEITVLRDPAREVSAGVAASVAQQYTVSVSSRTLGVATVMALGGDTPTDEQLATMPTTALYAITDVLPGGHEVGAATFFGASMSIMFLFFTIAFAARSLITEQRTGLIARMRATSASSAAIVTGKVLAVSLLGFAGFVTVWGVTTFVFDSVWGSPVAVVATIAATVLAVGGVATFVCGLARTEEQADGYTSIVAFALALLGGNFLGPGQAPDALKKAAAFTPNGQALDAFTRIAADGAGAGDVARQLAVLLLFAVAFGAAGLVLLKRAGS